MKTKSLKIVSPKENLGFDSTQFWRYYEVPTVDMNSKHFTHLKILLSQSHSAEFLQRYEWICSSAHLNLSKKKLARHNNFSRAEWKILAR